MKTDAKSSLKFLRLRRRLNLPDYQIVGILESLWIYAAVHCKTGAIGKLSNEDIAATISWDGEADELVNSLIDSGWLDLVPNANRLVIHDWYDHAAQHITRHLRDQYGIKNFQDWLEFMNRPEEGFTNTGLASQSLAKDATNQGLASQKAVRSRATKPNQTKPPPQPPVVNGAPAGPPVAEAAAAGYVSLKSNGHLPTPVSANTGETNGHLSPTIAANTGENQRPLPAASGFGKHEGSADLESNGHASAPVPTDTGENQRPRVGASSDGHRGSAGFDSRQPTSRRWDESAEKFARTRLESLGVQRSAAAVWSAKRNAIGPQELFSICDEFEANRDRFRGSGAIIDRIQSGSWSAEVVPVEKAIEAQRKAEEAKRKRENESIAHRIIRNGRKRGASDDEIKSELSNRGLSWP